MNTENKPSSFSKTDQRFWYDRLFKRGDSTDWQVQIGFAGEQERFPLKTPNKEAAAARARDIYLSLHSKGWETTRTEFKPWTNQVQKISSPTVGEFLAAVEKHGGISPITFASYARKFRRLVSAVAEIKGDASRYHHGAGSVKWRENIEVVRLDALTPAAITRWRDDFLSAKRGDALKQHHAQTTAHSILRNSRCLFSARVRRKLTAANVELQWPAPMPFEGVEVGIPPATRYISTIDAAALARAASKELTKKEPELFKIFLLAFGVGLRRAEIDRLTWAQFNWSKDQINVVVTEHGDTKTESSIAAVDVDPAVMKIFQKFKLKAAGEFVIESTVKPRPGVNWHHYRCDCAFKRLNAWLHGHGVNAQKPLHTLRKEFGSMICEQFGIFAASEALRHSDIRLTRANYVDRRGRIHLEVGKMLGGGK